MFLPRGIGGAAASGAASAPTGLRSRPHATPRPVAPSTCSSRGRPNEALGYLASLEARSAGEPLFHIIRARCYQEFVPMDDANKATGRERSRALARRSRPVHRRLHAADRHRGPRIRSSLLYRGWAWMSKGVRPFDDARPLHGGQRREEGERRISNAYLASNPGRSDGDGPTRGVPLFRGHHSRRVQVSVEAPDAPHRRPG